MSEETEFCAENLSKEIGSLTTALANVYWGLPRDDSQLGIDWQSIFEECQRAKMHLAATTRLVEQVMNMAGERR